jgi:hypothetical protein
VHLLLPFYSVELIDERILDTDNVRVPQLIGVLEVPSMLALLGSGWEFTENVSGVLLNNFGQFPSFITFIEIFAIELEDDGLYELQ